MIISWLECFLEVHKTLSFSRAADELFISQPALSKSIRSLEAELGVALFERTTRTVNMTKAGEELLPYAQSIVNSYNQANQSLQRYRKRNRHEIQVVTFPVMHLFGLSETMSQYRKLVPDVKLNILEAEMNATLKKIVSNDFDIALIRSVCLEDWSNYTVHHTFKDEIVIICDPKHPFASRKNVSLAELNEESIVCINSALYEYQRALAPFGFDSLFQNNVRNTVTSSLALQQFVSQQFGISILSLSVAKNMREQGNIYEVAVVPIKEKPDFSLCIATQKGSLTTECIDLLNFLKTSGSK